MPSLRSERLSGVEENIGNVVLVLHGGGSLGAFECGAYRAISSWLRNTGTRLVAVAGASIGAINAAVIARHCTEADGGRGVLDHFWRELAVRSLPFFPLPGEYWQRWNGLLTGLARGNSRL